MIPNTSTLTTDQSRPTQHAMLVAWGHFARSIGLLPRLSEIEIAQKAVVRIPGEKIVEFLIGLLAGIEYLADLSAGPAPLTQDAEVAQAWQLQPLADASGVSRTLAACDCSTVQALEEALEKVGQPFLDQAVREMRKGQETLVLDADLTGRPVSSTSRTFPEARFGYMDGEIRLGYQLAEICLQTPRLGRQWLSAQHHPGDTMSAGCLEELVHEAEHRLGCHPQRRTALLAQRIAAREQVVRVLREQLVQVEPRQTRQRERIGHLEGQIRDAEVRIQGLLGQPVSSRQDGRYSSLNRLRRQGVGWQRQLAHAHQRLTRLDTVTQHRQQRWQQRLALQESALQHLRERYARFCSENARQVDPPHCRIRLDAGFCNGENLTALIEWGYDLETKSGNPAVLTALRNRVPPETVWTPVGKNAEMVGWTSYQISTCPYPLTVGLERFHSPQGESHAVLVRYQDGTPTTCPDLEQWFHDYNGRQIVEAGNKEEKTTFKIQHLMSRSPAGIELQAQLTVFAANFVRWADHWVRKHIEQSTRRFETALSSPKRLVRVAANSPAIVEHTVGQEAIRFSPLSCFDGVVIRLSEGPEYQLPLPFIANDHSNST